ncbi:MAG: UDP-N-acetylmuramate dehydrogenase [Cellvibrionales bacterium TMED148]|nr:UDP-N-acetylenolpyruvoylglucosamine reductase [Porticoccaceae bacterium]RPG92404.1 MAG: UDP-N-acetylmuramate dehydrogenase [Cellvibrionales bacterium TMED148]
MNPKVLKTYHLDEFNSFSLSSVAEYFCSICCSEDLRYALDFASRNNLDITILGEGTNVILNQKIPGLVLKIDIKGKTFKQEGQEIVVEVGAGESWPSLVDWTLGKSWYGLENLSLIPGTAGAAPIQNIGAFGVELSERLISVKAVFRATGETIEIGADECDFGYRHSRFKRNGAGTHVITAIKLRLYKQAKLNYSYPSLKQALLDKLGTMTDDNLSPRLISDTVKQLRQKNLPDPVHWPNAGSFFKNPIVDREHLNDLLASHPKLPYFPVADDLAKVPAAWMIDHCNFRGYKYKNVGVHKSHALVLVNYGSGSFSEIVELSDLIKNSVEKYFSVRLIIEPTLYGID